MSSITVIGTGYVGLVTGAGFAHLGHDVICVDVDADKVESLQRGSVPIFEQGLDDLVADGLAAGRLSFQVGHSPQSLASDFQYLCVQTPAGPDGTADLRFLEAAANELRDGNLAAGAIVVNKSTVPVGSARFVEQVLERPDLFVVSNPEFLREGSAVRDFLSPDRIVIGGDAQQAAARVAALYHPLDAPVLITDPASAELIKYAANAFLATKLSFVNAVAAICEGVGADIADVRLGMGYDHRIGLDFLQPGPGWGGSCFPKDTRAMLRIAESAGYDFTLLEGAIGLNEQQFDRVVDRLEAALAVPLAGKTVTLFGLAFKAGTDDTRMSPALEVADRLLARGVTLRSFDPEARVDRIELGQHVDPYAAATGADAVVVLTEWPAFKWLDYAKVAEVMAGSVVLDTRGVLERGALHGAGLDLTALGRS